MRWPNAIPRNPHPKSDKAIKRSGSLVAVVVDSSAWRGRRGLASSLTQASIIRPLEVSVILRYFIL